MQKYIAKLFLWGGLSGFIFSALGIWIAARAEATYLTHLWISAMAFVAALGLGIVNFAIVFVRHPVFAPGAQRVPRKYYGILLALFILLGLGLLFG